MVIKYILHFYLLLLRLVSLDKVVYGFSDYVRKKQLAKPKHASVNSPYMYVVILTIKKNLTFMTITNNKFYIYGKMCVKLKDKKQTKSNKETIINDEIRALFHNRYKIIVCIYSLAKLY